MNPDQLPPPDLIDSGGRMRRLVISFVIAVVVASIVYLITNGLAKPDEMPGGMDGGSQRRAFGFVFYMTGIAFAASLAGSLAILKMFANRRYKQSLAGPSAKVVRR
jgi:hypothetical protein